MLLPEGTYPAVATEHQWGTSKNGHEQVAICFQIVDGPQSGQFATWNGYFSGKAEKITMKALRACGWKGDDLMNLGELNQRVSIAIEHETSDEGKTYHKVQWVNAPGGLALKDPMSSDKLRMFAAKMKAKAAQVKEVAGERVEADRAEPPSQRNEAPPPGNGNDYDGPPPHGDADIPF
jgi:hypothetical protein